jgi:thioredoxin 1
MEEPDTEIEITDEEFNNIIKQHEFVVVNFFAEWHMNCLMITPIIEDLASKLTHVKFVKINIDDNEKLKDVHKIYIMPCVLVFKNGLEIARILGNNAADILEEKIRACLNC